MLGNQDLDLYKLYKIVQEHGGMEKVGGCKIFSFSIVLQMKLHVRTVGVTLFSGYWCVYILDS